MTDPIQIARDRFSKGFNCSQSVFSAYASQLGIDSESALKLASPFGGGVAHQGNVCGAVTGALMALGLARGSASFEKDKKDETYRIAEDFIKRFRELHDTVLCHELIGYDISTPEGLQNAREQNVFASACPVYVKDAAELVAEFLDE
jgi:C_GCAxxG_C_C family probable redox protein